MSKVAAAAALVLRHCVGAGGHLKLSWGFPPMFPDLKGLPGAVSLGFELAQSYRES